MPARRRTVHVCIRIPDVDVHGSRAVHAAPVPGAVEEDYLRVAGLVRAGEWCTYGDISTAVRGDPWGARAVGRAAATHPDFPNAHRVLRSGGAVAEEWGVAEGLGPDECRRRLEAEGVAFGADGRARPEFRVAWDELVLRDRAHGAGPRPSGRLRPSRRPPPGARR